MVRLFFIQSIFILFFANIRIFPHICEGEKENREGEKKKRLHDSAQTPSRLQDSFQIQIAELDFVIEYHEEAMVRLIVSALPHLIPDVQGLLIIAFQVEHMNLVRIDFLHPVFYFDHLASAPVCFSISVCDEQKQRNTNIIMQIVFFISQYQVITIKGIGHF
jgi:hypothetical protein